ncbi:MAG: Rrf2 family transcriptional regulator [Chloroflexota bacterium]
MTAITRKADYAARILLHLAMSPPRTWITTQEIARQQLIPGRLIRHVVASLVSAGLLRTKRGSGGGIRMARPASEISLLDAVEAVEGPFYLNICVTDPQGCLLARKCPVHEVWERVQETLVDQLRRETFGKLAQRAQGRSVQ